MKKFLSLIFAFLVTLSVNAEEVRFVQISDARFSLQNETSVQTLEDTISKINKIKDIDFVVFTGDNTNKAIKSDYEAFLLEAKKLKVPFYLALGDHDVNKHKEMSKKEYFKILKKHYRRTKQEQPNFAFVDKGVTFIIADGSKDVIPTPNGVYKQEVLDWLTEQLDLYKDKNVIILQHFPIVPPIQKEGYYTFKPEIYMKLLNSHKNVKAVIAGHFGVNQEISIDGVSHISTAPLPNFRIIDIIDCETNSPTIWSELY